MTQAATARSLAAARLGAAALLLCACEVGHGASWSAPAARADLSLRAERVLIDGVSRVIGLPVSPGATSLLVEVEGRVGQYYVARLASPSGTELIESGNFVTRSARERPGAVSWMFPNSPRLAIEPGTYELTLMATDADARPLRESVIVRSYVKQALPEPRCGLTFAFLVAENAVEGAALDIDSLIELVADAAPLLRSASIEIADYRYDRVLGDTPLAVMAAAQAQGLVRPGDLPVVVAHGLGGVLGYALGLPGPFEVEMDHAAVLLSREGFGAAAVDSRAMAATLVHEIGHYLGLYHTSEADALVHDPIPDTPECSNLDCEDGYWTNLMTQGGGEGRTSFTEQQAEVMRNHPLCAPL